MSAPPSVDRSRPPRGGASRPFRFPSPLTGRLAAGPRLLLAPRPGCGLVQVELVCPAGAEHERADQAGLATLAASLLDEGTAGSDALEIARRIESLGGSLSTSADWDAAYLSVSLLAGHLEAGLRLLAELAREASFPPAEVERLRRQRLAELQRRTAQPAFVAAITLARALYGDRPYGGSLLGRPAAIAELEREQIVAFARRHVVPRGAVLLAAGEFEPTALEALAGELLDGWQGEPAPPPPPLSPPAASARRVLVVDRPAAPQTELRLGHPGVPRRHADFAALAVVNSLLAGKFTSRLNLSLRERHGITYGVASRFTGRHGAGPFVVAAAVDNAAVGLAAGEMVAELERLQRQPVADDELADSRSYLLGVFPYTLQTIGGVCQRLEVLAVHDLPPDHYLDYQQRIAAVEPQDVQRLAREHLTPDRAVIVAVGPADQIAGQLTGLGDVERLTGVPWEAEAAATSDAASLLKSTV